MYLLGQGVVYYVKLWQLVYLEVKILIIKTTNNLVEIIVLQVFWPYAGANVIAN